VPLDARTEDDRADVLAWIASGVELCRQRKPDIPPRHLVSYVVPLDSRGEAILLGAHRGSGLWLPPGGHVEPGEHPQDTARRECAEELGVELPLALARPVLLTSTLTTGTAGQHTDVSFWYVAAASRGDSFAFDPGEFREMRWFSLDALPAAADPEMERFARACRAISRA
jgi:8-oxo-dGTP pyrophosphatase MutT (NUDIX family)